MPILFDDLNPGDIVSYPNPDEESLRYLLYIGKKKALLHPFIKYVFVTKQLRPSYKHEPSYETLEAFQPLDLVRHKDAILAVYNELMAENVPDNSYIWEHLGIKSPEHADLPWHHLVRIILSDSEASRRKLSLVEKKMNLIKEKDLFKGIWGHTTLGMPIIPPKGGKHP